MPNPAAPPASIAPIRYPPALIASALVGGRALNGVLELTAWQLRSRVTKGGGDVLAARLQARLSWAGGLGDYIRRTATAAPRRAAPRARKPCFGAPLRSAARETRTRPFRGPRRGSCRSRAPGRRRDPPAPLLVPAGPPRVAPRPAGVGAC